MEADNKFFNEESVFKMKLKDKLDLTKYKRFFAFGCSFTSMVVGVKNDYIGRNVGEYYNLVIYYDNVDISTVHSSVKKSLQKTI